MYDQQTKKKAPTPADIFGVEKKSAPTPEQIFGAADVKKKEDGTSLPTSLDYWNAGLDVPSQTEALQSDQTQATTEPTSPSGVSLKQLSRLKNLSDLKLNDDQKAEITNIVRGQPVLDASKQDPVREKTLPLESKVFELQNEMRAGNINPEQYFTEIAKARSGIDNIHKTAFTPRSATDYLQNKVPFDMNTATVDSVEGAIDKNNSSDVLAFSKFKKARTIDDALSAPTFEEGGIKYAMANNPQVAKQIEMLGGVTDNLPNAYAGDLVAKFLYDPDVIEAVKENPDLVKKWKETQFNLYNHYPDYAKTVVANIISQAREDSGMNSWTGNAPTKESTDALVEDLMKEGKIGPREKAVYEEQIRPYQGVWRSIGRGIGRVVAPAFVNENPIKTPDVLSTTGDSYVNTLRGVAHSIENGIDTWVQGPTGAGPKLTDESKRLNDLLQHEYSQVSVDPKGVMNNLSQSTGHITGFVVPMILGGSLGQAAGLGARASTALTNGLMFQGINSDNAATYFPGNTLKQNMYTIVGTAGDMMLGELLPTKKVADAARNILHPEIRSVVSALADGEITADVARNRLLTAAKNVIGNNAQVGSIMAGFDMFHNGLDAITGGRDVSFDQAANSAMNTFKTGFLGSTFLNSIREIGSGNGKVPTQAIYEMSNNPEHFRQVIEQTAALDPALEATKNERLRNLNEAAQINMELRDTELSQPQKEKYLVTALQQKIWERKAEATTDDVLKADYEKRAADLSTQKEAIFNPQAAPQTTEREIDFSEADKQKFFVKPERTPEELITEKGAPGMVGDLVKAGTITPDQGVLEIAKQRQGISDSGEDVGEGRPRDAFQNFDQGLMDAVDKKFPDKQSVIDAIKPQTNAEAQTQTEAQTIPQVGEGQKPLQEEPSTQGAVTTTPSAAPLTEAKAKRLPKTEQPQGEYPIYSVQIGDKTVHVQRAEGMNPGDTAWYEVEKDDKGRWRDVLQSPDEPWKTPYQHNIGFTKAEAIDHVVGKYSGEQEPAVQQADVERRREEELQASKPEMQAQINEKYDNELAALPKEEPTVTEQPVEQQPAEKPMEQQLFEPGSIDEIVSKINSDKPLTEQDKAVLQENPEEVAKRVKAQAKQQKVEAFNKKVDKVAENVNSFIQKYLSADLPEGTQKLGASLSDLVNAAANIVKQAHLVGADIADAIDRAIDHVRSNWQKNWKSFPEQELRKLFNDIIAVPDVNKQTADKFANTTPEEALTMVRQKNIRTEKVLAEKRKRTFAKFYTWWLKHIEDISANAKEALRNAGGEEAVMYKDIANKAGGPAGLKIEEQDNKIFKGLDHEEMRDLGNIINAKRTILIDRMRDMNGMERAKHSEGFTSELYQKMLDRMRAENPDRFDNLSARADEYFKSMQELLDLEKENGLHNDEGYAALKEQSFYSPRIFIEHLDERDKMFNGGRKVSVADSGVKRLQEGSEDLMIENPRLLLSLRTEKAYKLMAKNDAAKALFNFAKTSPNNGVVRPRKVVGVTKSGNVIYEDVPAGESVLHAMVDGTARDMIVSKDFANEWVSTDPAINAAFGEAVQWLTGSTLMRYSATGLNPVFALANLPRDMAYIYFTQNAYSKILPKAIGQFSADIAKVWPDVWGRKGRYKDFIKEGGSIELLTHQGRIYQGKGANEGINKVSHFMGWFGETSELLTRLALRERGITNGVEQFKKTNGRDPNAAEMKKIQTKATYDAINQLDFSQGGDYAKALNKFVPYFNASIQATRGFVRAIRNNPKEVGIKAAQLMGIAGGLTAWNVLQPGYNDVSDDEKARNYIFMLPFSRIDDKGRRRYTYIKYPKSQEVQGISSIADQVVEFAMTGKKPTREAVAAASNQLPDIPFVTQGTPIWDAIQTYRSNYDTYFDERLWKGKNTVPNRLQFTQRTPEAYKIIGHYTGWSPDRLRGATRKVLPSIEKNPFVTIPGKLFKLGLEASGKEKREELNKSFLQHFKDVTGGLSGKFVGETFPVKKKQEQPTGKF